MLTDTYQVYRWLPTNRHMAGKGGEVNRGDGMQSQLRDKLKRLHRRTVGTARASPCFEPPLPWSACD